MKTINESKAAKKDFTESNQWTKQAEPILNDMLSSWKLTPVEWKDNEASVILKECCGIDYLLSREGSLDVYGVACRVQSGKNYRTFTVPQWCVSYIVGHSLLKPTYTMQVYLSGDKCLSGDKIIGLGLIETDDLMEFIERGLADTNGRYYVCSWDKLQKAGYEVMEYRAEPVAEDTAKKATSQTEKHFRVYKNGQEYEDEEAMRELAKNVGMTYDEVNDLIEEFFNE